MEAREERLCKGFNTSTFGWKDRESDISCYVSAQAQEVTAKVVQQE